MKIIQLFSWQGRDINGRDKLDAAVNIKINFFKEEIKAK